MVTPHTTLFSHPTLLKYKRTKQQRNDCLILVHFYTCMNYLIASNYDSACVYICVSKVCQMQTECRNTTCPQCSYIIIRESEVGMAQTRLLHNTFLKPPTFKRLDSKAFSDSLHFWSGVQSTKYPSFARTMSESGMEISKTAISSSSQFFFCSCK